MRGLRATISAVLGSSIPIRAAFPARCADATSGATHSPRPDAMNARRLVIGTPNPHAAALTAGL